MTTRRKASDDLRYAGKLVLALVLVVGSGLVRELAVADPAMAPQPRLIWSQESNQAVASFGQSVASAGDVNGDGYADIVVGAPGYDHGEDNEGRAYLFLGGPGEPSSSPAWTWESDEAGANCGDPVSSAGDVNGDGFSDVVVGASSGGNGGRAYAYYGSTSGLHAAPDWMVEVPQTDAYFGCSVSGAGDVNGDGYDDVIVGALGYDHGENHEGRAYLYLGSPTGLSTSPDWLAESDLEGSFFGRAVAAAGDVNGDGFSDVIVGAHQYGTAEWRPGGAFVYLGSPSGLGVTPAWTGSGEQGGSAYGAAARGVGDVNGDGFGDVAVGAYDLVVGPSHAGRCYVYFGGSSGLAVSPAWVGTGDLGGSQLGLAIGSPTDVNTDGYSDLIVGAPGQDVDQMDEGQVRVYLGGKDGPSIVSDWLLDGNQTNSRFGIAVGGAGDVDGDGIDDFIVGAPSATNGESAEGRAFVYRGYDLIPLAVGQPLADQNQFSIESIRPNPFHDRVEISLTVPLDGQLAITVFDPTGRRVRRLSSGALAGGRFSVSWDGRSESGERAPAGTYLLEVRSGQLAASGKIRLVR